MRKAFCWRRIHVQYKINDKVDDSYTEYIQFLNPITIEEDIDRAFKKNVSFKYIQTPR